MSSPNCAIDARSARSRRDMLSLQRGRRASIAAWMGTGAGRPAAEARHAVPATSTTAARASAAMRMGRRRRLARDLPAGGGVERRGRSPRGTAIVQCACGHRRPSLSVRRARATRCRAVASVHARRWATSAYDICRTTRSSTAARCVGGNAARRDRSRAAPAQRPGRRPRPRSRPRPAAASAAATAPRSRRARAAASCARGADDPVRAPGDGLRHPAPRERHAQRVHATVPGLSSATLPGRASPLRYRCSSGAGSGEPPMASGSQRAAQQLVGHLSARSSQVSLASRQTSDEGHRPAAARASCRPAGRRRSRDRGAPCGRSRPARRRPRARRGHSARLSSTETSRSASPWTSSTSTPGGSSIGEGAPRSSSRSHRSCAGAELGASGRSQTGACASTPRTPHAVRGQQREVPAGAVAGQRDARRGRSPPAAPPRRPRRPRAAPATRRRSRACGTRRSRRRGRARRDRRPRDPRGRARTARASSRRGRARRPGAGPRRPGSQRSATCSACGP